MENEESSELEKCKNDPYHFYSNYWLINGKKPSMSRDEFESRWDSCVGYDIKNKEYLLLKSRNLYAKLWDNLKDTND